MFQPSQQNSWTQLHDMKHLSQFAKHLPTAVGNLVFQNTCHIRVDQIPFVQDSFVDWLDTYGLWNTKVEPKI